MKIALLIVQATKCVSIALLDFTYKMVCVLKCVRGQLTKIWLQDSALLVQKDASIVMGLIRAFSVLIHISCIREFAIQENALKELTFTIPQLISAGLILVFTTL